MSAALAPVRPRLGLLIPRLATEHDGEIVATVRAIGRTLKGAGLDFHDLAFVIGEEPKPIAYKINYDNPRRGTPCDMPPTWKSLGRISRIAWLDSVLSSPWATEWEVKLASDVRAIVWSSPHKLQTPKQRGALDRLIVRAFIMGERP